MSECVTEPHCELALTVPGEVPRSNLTVTRDVPQRDMFTQIFLKATFDNWHDELSQGQMQVSDGAI